MITLWHRAGIGFRRRVMNAVTPKGVDHWFLNTLIRKRVM
ncbi:hypothetical protein FRUB_10171 [Fimbriiglobus ruber]|uniref:Uncharacterized protein n=1 Tax=Fimbriiglobus ruber TaxID=1908690 RepID=A0A225CXV6_9BACT|nr:hypothetical protein FRUB_10171 [Fimbriiglobus ruber]